MVKHLQIMKVPNHVKRKYFRHKDNQLILSAQKSTVYSLQSTVYLKKKKIILIYMPKLDVGPRLNL